MIMSSDEQTSELAHNSNVPPSYSTASTSEPSAADQQQQQEPLLVGSSAESHPQLIYQLSEEREHHEQQDHRQATSWSSHQHSMVAYAGQHHEHQHHQHQHHQANQYYHHYNQPHSFANEFSCVQQETLLIDYGYEHYVADQPVPVIGHHHDDHNHSLIALELNGPSAATGGASEPSGGGHCFQHEAVAAASLGTSDHVAFQASSEPNLASLAVLSEGSPRAYQQAQYAPATQTHELQHQVHMSSSYGGQRSVSMGADHSPLFGANSPSASLMTMQHQSQQQIAAILNDEQNTNAAKAPASSSFIEWSAPPATSSRLVWESLDHQHLGHGNSCSPIDLPLSVAALNESSGPALVVGEQRVAGAGAANKEPVEYTLLDSSSKNEKAANCPASRGLVSMDRESGALISRHDSNWPAPSDQQHQQPAHTFESEYSAAGCSGAGASSRLVVPVSCGGDDANSLFSDEEDEAGGQTTRAAGFFKPCEWILHGDQKCMSTFTNLKQFVEHLELEHVKQDPERKGRFFCRWANCKRLESFNARYKLLVHMRVHSGEKPFPCKEGTCKKRFSRLENLKIHVRSHTGEKPYSCTFPDCSKSFTNSSDRIKHHKTHTDPVSEASICTLFHTRFDT